MKNNALNITLFIVAFVWIFGIGLVVGKFLSSTSTPIIVNTTDGNTEKTSPLVSYDVLIVSKDAPHTMLVLDFFELGGIHTGRANYFDGERWLQTRFDKDVIKVNEVESLNQFENSVSGQLQIEDFTLSVNIPSIHTPIAVRGEKDFVKFAGSTPTSGAYMRVEDTAGEYYAALIKGYAADYHLVDIEALGVKTDWLTYWDSSWNFYHLDKTEVDVYHPEYTSHSFFAKQTPSSSKYGYGTVEYFSEISTSRNENVFQIGSPQNLEYKEMSLNIHEGYTWPEYKNNYVLNKVDSEDGGIGLLLQINTDKSPQ